MVTLVARDRIKRTGVQNARGDLLFGKLVGNGLLGLLC
jgi:hypothetical protein